MFFFLAAGGVEGGGDHCVIGFWHDDKKTDIYC